MGGETGTIWRNTTHPDRALQELVNINVIAGRERVVGPPGVADGGDVSHIQFCDTGVEGACGAEAGGADAPSNISIISGLLMDRKKTGGILQSKKPICII